MSSMIIVISYLEGDAVNISLGSVIADTRTWFTMNFQNVNDDETVMKLIKIH